MADETFDGDAREGILSAEVRKILRQLAPSAGFRASLADYLADLPRPACDFDPAVDGAVQYPVVPAVRSDEREWAVGEKIDTSGRPGIPLTEMSVDLSGVRHMTPGLLSLENVRVGLLGGGFFGPPLFIMQQSPGDGEGQDDEDDDGQEEPGGQPPGEPPAAPPVRVRVCVRFFVVDECGGRRLGNQTGLLAGVVYEQKFPDHIGTLSSATVDRIYDLLEGVNRIWAQCGIEFEFLETIEGPFIHALDLDALPFEITANASETKAQGFIQYDNDRLLPIRVIETMSLCAFFDPGTKRRITVNKFFKPVPVKWNKIVWDIDKSEYGAVKNKKVTAKDIRDARDSVPKDKQQPYNDLLNLAKKTPRLSRSAEQLFTHAVDEFHGTECINVYVVENIEDTGIAGLEAGLAPIGTLRNPGRSVFLDDTVVTGNENRVLAHEFGHCFGLEHDTSPNNLMDPKGRGTLIKKGGPGQKEQCENALDIAERIPK